MLAKNMKTSHFEKLLYLDRDFISSKYEYEEGIAPNTTISKTESIKAAAKAFLFSGGASASESKIYKLSTIGMLQKLEKKFEEYPEFNSSDFKLGLPSQICWIEGNLTIHTVQRTRHTSTITLIGPPQKDTQKKGPELLGEESYYAVEAQKYKFALVPTVEYWVSGVAAFQDLIDNVIGPLDIPVKALLRIYAAQTSFEQWMAVPIVIKEK